MVLYAVLITIHENTNKKISSTVSAWNFCLVVLHSDGVMKKKYQLHNNFKRVKGLSNPTTEQDDDKYCPTLTH